MRRLRTLNPVPSNDSGEVKELFPAEASQHSGRMRVSLIANILDIHQDEIERLGEPLIGTGSVCIAASYYDIAVYGCEFEERWVEVAKQVAKNTECDAVIWPGNSLDCPPLISQRFDALLTSPPFPNAHSQGNSEMQQGMLEQKQTYAGNEFALEKVWGCGSNPNQERWVKTLGRLLDMWCYNLESGGKLFIHVKDFVRSGAVVDVGTWVAEAFEIADIELLGDYGAPLAYRSGFQEWARYHKRKILEWVDDVTVKLECGHTASYTKPPKKRPKKKVCTGEGCMKEDHVEVREERIIVGCLP